MLTCSICGHGCVYVCTRGGELWIREAALRLLECSSSPKGSCVPALSLLTPDLAAEGHASCLITWKVMKPLGQQNTAQLWAPKGK